MGRRKKRGNGGGRRHAAAVTCPEFDVEINTPLAFGIGTRVELPDLASLGINSEADGPHIGTIIAHWQRKAHWHEHVRAPYLVMLDDGTAVFCPRVDEAFIRESDIPPMKVVFGIGSRVECRYAGGEKWYPGTVIHRNVDWAECKNNSGDFFIEYPYLIKFDYGREKSFWGPACCIRKSNTSVAPNKMDDSSLRFKVGDRVDCSCSDEWMPGVIVQTWYWEEDFADGHMVPYQILLDCDGGLIFAPSDTHDCIRRSKTPEQPLRFEPGDRVECNVEEGWMSGTVITTWYGAEGFNDGKIVPYQVLLDDKEFVFAPQDSDLFIRRPIRFKAGTRVDCFHEEIWIPGTVLKTRYEEEDNEFSYKIQLDTGDSINISTDSEEYIRKSTMSHICRGEHDGFVRVAVTMMITNEDFEGAAEILEERIELIRQKITRCTQKRDVACYRADLSNFLSYQSEVHQATGSWDDMKVALDEVLDLLEFSCDGSQSHRRMHVNEKLAMHACLTGDNQAAVKHYEQAIQFSKEITGHDSFRLGFMLFKCGKLSVACSERERGLKQISEGVDILTRVCGSDDETVEMAREYLKMMKAEE